MVTVPEWMKPKGIVSAVSNSVNNVKDEMGKAYQNYQVNTVANKVQPKTSSTTVTKPNQIDGIYNQMEGYRNQLSQPMQQFSYDINSDPQYQAALRQARAVGERESNNTTARLRAGGQGKSSWSEGVAHQIGQEAVGRVSDTLVPQMMQQAYSRYSDQQNRQRQSVLDQLGVLQTQYGMTSDADARDFRDMSYTDERDFRDRSYADTRADIEAAREYQAKQDRIALANYMSEQFGVQVDPKMDTNLVYEQVRGLNPLNMQQFEEGIRQYDQNYNRGVLESDRNFNRGVLESDRSYGMQGANLALQRQQESRVSGNQNLDNLYRQWQATGRAPAGIPGVEPGTPLYDQVGARQGQGGTITKADAKDSAEYKGQASDYISNMTRSEAKEYLSQVRDYFTDADYRALLQEADDLSD